MTRSRRPLLSTIALAVAVAAAMAALATPVAHAAAQAGHVGPINPAFRAWLRDRTASPLAPTAGSPLGALVPVPVDPVAWSKARLRRGPLALGDTSLPSSYDPRSDPTYMNLLPAIRYQGPYADCWAFASIASLEWDLLRDDPPTTTLLGEYDLAYKAAYKPGNPDEPNVFDWGLQEGGNYQMATAELARWNAPVSASAGNPGDGTRYVSGLPTVEHVHNVLFLPDRASSLDNATIEAAVLQYGAVYTAMYADGGMTSDTNSAYYNKSKCAYYFSGSTDPDHAVDIVGWDDSYSRNNFRTNPGMDGAFICRNSWGTDWGDGGYFYVSYADTLIGTSMAVFTGQATTDYAQNLGHDTLGLTGNYGYKQNGVYSDTAWMAAGFTVKGDSSLEAAGLYALSPGTSYTLFVGPSLANHATWTSVGSGTLDVAGYHTVVFSAPQNAVAGVKFYVIAELTAPGSGANIGGPIPLEDYVPDYSSKATSAPGQSYVSCDGSQWTDLDVTHPTLKPDVCLKVFASPATPDPVKPVTKALAAVKVVRGRYATLRYRVNDATPHDIEKVTIKITNRSGKVVKTLSAGCHAPGASLSVRYRCLLARGGYHFCVYATDRWGNTQTHVGRAAFTVK